MTTTYSDEQIETLINRLHRSQQYPLTIESHAALRSLLAERQAASRGQGGDMGSEPVALAVFVPGDNTTGNMRIWTGKTDSVHMFLEAHGLPSHTPVTPLYTQPVRSVSDDECPACHKNWGEHRSGYSASQCKMKPQKQVARGVSEEDVDVACDVYMDASPEATEVCSYGMRAALTHFAANGQEKQS